MQHARAIAGTAAVAAVSAFIGYNYGQRPRVEATPPAKSEVGQNTPPAEIPANAKSAEPRKARANTASTRRPVSKTPPRAAQKGGNAAPAPAAPREQVTGTATADGAEE
jgi:hypothetical protein